MNYISINPKLVHFIGIYGSGMKPLAQLAKLMGYEVQGSDLSPIEHVSDLGPVVRRHDLMGWLPAGIVVYSSAISRENPELLSAIQSANLGVKVFHRSEFLDKLMSQQKQILVTGTHGKSTTSSIITHILDDLQLDPTAVIGAVMSRYGDSLRFGKGAYFIAEADESDGTFLSYHPHVAIVTNVDLDHMEFYKTYDNLKSYFSQFIDLVSDVGASILYWDQDWARNIVKLNPHKNFLTFGLNLGCDVRAINISNLGFKTRFLAVIERDQIPVEIPLIGTHNVLNALAALATSRVLGQDILQAAESLKSFRGVHRRLTTILQNSKVRIFDDYAHNPGKMTACIDSLKASFPHLPLIVIFQPHRFSRLETMYDEMLSSFKKADLVIVTPVYSAGEIDSGLFSPLSIALDLSKRSQTTAIGCLSLDDVIPLIKECHLSNPTILTLGAGDVNALTPKIQALFND
jgi:UDP-N-acetylmuramate--alanine ligase